MKTKTMGAWFAVVGMGLGLAWAMLAPAAGDETDASSTADTKAAPAVEAAPADAEIAPSPPAQEPPPAEMPPAPGEVGPPLPLEEEPGERPSGEFAPAPHVQGAPAMPSTGTPAALPAARPPLGPTRELRLNFQNAPLVDVLQYLSEAAGFIIVQETPLSGTVNVIALQPLSPEEAVDLLNTLLAEKGFAALRTGRILRIVDRRTAARRPLPVQTATRPEDIAPTEELATRIIPLRFAPAARVVENLAPLLAEGAMMTANESSNSIILTDTGTNARRIIEIVKALDNSIAGIAEIRVFPLRHARAADAAQLLTDFFTAGGTGGAAISGPQGRMAQMVFLQRQMQRGGTGAGPTSDPRAAAIQISAVADERTNSVVVSAPQDLMPTITEILDRLDADEAALTRYFRLERADAMETAEILRDLFGTTVTIVGDPRTNTVMVRAPAEWLIQIAEAVGRLDTTDARTQQVFVYPIRHADPENLANIMQNMFQDGTRSTTTRARTTSTTSGSTTGSSRLAERAARGASTESTTSGSTRSATRR